MIFITLAPESRLDSLKTLTIIFRIATSLPMITFFFLPQPLMMTRHISILSLLFTVMNTVNEFNALFNEPIFICANASLYRNLYIYLSVITQLSLSLPPSLSIWIYPLHLRKGNSIVFSSLRSVSASASTSVRPACRSATLAGNCTAWNTESSPTVTSVSVLDRSVFSHIHCISFGIYIFFFSHIYTCSLYPSHLLSIYVLLYFLSIFTFSPYESGK